MVASTQITEATSRASAASLGVMFDDILAAGYALLSLAIIKSVLT
jgi:phosphatidylglycerophosphatase A